MNRYEEVCRESDSEEKSRIIARALMDKEKEDSGISQDLIEVLKELNLVRLGLNPGEV